MTKKDLPLLIKQNARTFLSGILLTAIFSSCGNTTKEINQATGKGVNTQEDKASDVVIHYSEKGRVRAILYAKEFIRNESALPPYTEVKKSLKVEFIDDSLHVESTLTSKYARLYENEENVLVRDSVVIVNKKGERLSTEELVWNKRAGKFYTEKKVQITTPSQVMYGDGLEANEDFSIYKITNLRGTLQVDKTEMPQ
jgi:LPS export ABC transporter protein LptC